MKLVFIIFFVSLSISNSFAQPSEMIFPAYFEKILIKENGKTVEANRLIIETRYAYFKADSNGILQSTPIPLKTEHPTHKDTLFIQRIPGVHSYLITLDGTETKIYFPSNNIHYNDASIYDFKQYPFYKRLFTGMISNPLAYSNKEVAIISLTNLVEWNDLETYNAEIHDKPPVRNGTITTNLVDAIQLVPNIPNTIQKPDSVIQVLFRNSINELVQDCKLSFLIDDKVVPLELISCETVGYGYCSYLIPDEYRNDRVRYQRIIAFHEDYQADTFHLNIGSQQFYLFKKGEPWICMGQKVPYKKPSSDYILAVSINSNVSFDSLARMYDLTIDSLLLNDPFEDNNLKRAYCSFKSHVDDNTKRKSVAKMNQNGRIIYPMAIAYNESYKYIVGLGNEVYVAIE